MGNYASASPRTRCVIRWKGPESGQQHNALELAQLAPEDLRSLLHPFMGGQWQNDTPTLRIPYYRSLGRSSQGFSLAGRSSIWQDRYSLV